MKKILAALGLAAALVVGGTAGANAATGPHLPPPNPVVGQYVIGASVDPTNTYTLTASKGVSAPGGFDVEFYRDGVLVASMTVDLPAGQPVTIDSPLGRDGYEHVAVYALQLDGAVKTYLGYANAQPYDSVGSKYVDIYTGATIPKGQLAR